MVLVVVLLAAAGGACSPLGDGSSRPNIILFITDDQTVGTVNRSYDYGVDLGGFVMKDRLWFFGAYDRVSERDLSTRINTNLVVPGFTIPGSLGQFGLPAGQQLGITNPSLVVQDPHFLLRGGFGVRP